MPGDIWDTVDLFWLCHAVDSTGSIQQLSLPEQGGLLAQDSWTIWAFAYTVSCWNELRRDLIAESQRAATLASMHEKVRRS